MAPRRSIGPTAALSLALLAGCAGVLGFEDIVVDAAPITPDASMIDVSEGTDATTPPKHCSATSPVVASHALSELNGDDPKGGEYIPRVTRDERTIVFMRITADNGTQAFVAHRPTRTVPFSPAVPIVATPSAQFPALTGDGGRYFHSQAVASGRALRTSLFTSDILTSSALGGLGDDPDSIEPFYSDTTRELFFARAPRTASPGEPAFIFGIYRAIGAGDSFSAAAHVKSIESVVAQSGLVSYYTLPVLSDDGTHLYFSVYPGPTTGVVRMPMPDTYVATRTDTTLAEFTAPLPVPGFVHDTRSGGIGGLSPDECTLYTYRLADGDRLRLFVEERAPD